MMDRRRYEDELSYKTDFLYMRGDEEIPEYVFATDEKIFREDGPIQRMAAGRSRQEEGISDQGYANYPYFTGGTFINPGVLPPIRTTRIQRR
jgi:hypothetical protein